MPMFDDPKKELSRLQQIMLEVDDNMDESKSEEEWLDSEIADLKSWLGMDDDNTADYQKYARQFREEQARASVRADYHEMEEKEEKKAADDARGQQILTFLLVLGILAVAGYWATILL